MTIEYPSHLICPNCKGEISLNYKNRIAETNDIVTFRIGTPQSRNSGKDSRIKKQNKRRSYVQIHFCNHCKVILGVSDWSR